MVQDSGRVVPGDDPSGTLKSLVTTLQIYRVSAAFVAVGLVLLAVWTSVALYHPDWPILAKYLEIFTSLFLGTGGLSILIDVATKRSLREETVQILHDFFNYDPKFATQLSPESKKRRVEALLQAHLGLSLGNAIFCGLVARYFPSQRVNKERAWDEFPLRDNAEFTIQLSPGDHFGFNEALDAGSKIDLSRYYNLQADYVFSGDFPHDERVTVVCMLSDVASDFQPLFSREDVLAREVLQMDRSDKDAILKRIEAEHDAEVAGHMIRTIANVEVSFNGEKLAPCSTKLDNDHSFSFTFAVSKVPKSKPDADLWTIRIQSIYLRAAGRFPIVMPCPTHRPVIRFLYSAVEIGSIGLAPFFNSGIVVREDRLNEKHFELRLFDKEGNPAWVFPGNGVLFTWQN